MSTNTELTTKRIKGGNYFVCPFETCGRRFCAQFALNRHLIVHSENKQYICEYCGKKFSLSQYLREHRYLHTNELPYICGISGCTMCFRQAGKLSLHRRTHPEYKLKKYDYSLNTNKRSKRHKKQIIQKNEPMASKDIIKKEVDVPKKNSIVDGSNNLTQNMNAENKIEKQTLLPSLIALEESLKKTTNSPTLEKFPNSIRTDNIFENFISNELIQKKKMDIGIKSSLESLLIFLRKKVDCTIIKCDKKLNYFSSLNIIKLTKEFDK